MEQLNFYDFISFPNRTERDKIRRDFFDFNALRLCEDDIIPHGNAVSTLCTFSVKERVSQKINHFNNNMSYLDLAGLQFSHYYNLFITETNKARKEYYDVLFKQAYRNMCCEIIVFKEKVTDFLRFVYHIKQKNIISVLNREFEKTDYGKVFNIAVQCFWADKNIGIVAKDRNDETHNETTLLTRYDTNSDINNKIYFERIKSCLFLMLELRDAFQKFLVKRYPDIKHASCTF